MSLQLVIDGGGTGKRLVNDRGDKMVLLDSVLFPREHSDDGKELSIRETLAIEVTPTMEHHARSLMNKLLLPGETVPFLGWVRERSSSNSVTCSVLAKIVGDSNDQ